jgi:hypothetical protein
MRWVLLSLHDLSTSNQRYISAHTEDASRLYVVTGQQRKFLNNQCKVAKLNLLNKPLALPSVTNPLLEVRILKNVNNKISIRFSAITCRFNSYHIQ